MSPELVNSMKEVGKEDVDQKDNAETNYPNEKRMGTSPRAFEIDDAEVVGQESHESCKGELDTRIQSDVEFVEESVHGTM